MRDRADQLVYSMFKPFVQSPPVDVEAVASQLGISVIRAADLLEDGRLISEDGRASIITRRGLSAERRRFTIAHEIGHLIMFDDRSKPVSRRRRGDSNDTERRCDQIAAALLLPHDWVKSEFAVRDHVFATLRDLARIAQVSMAAALVRLQEVARWDQALLRFRYVDGKWRFASAAGFPPELHRQLRFTGTTRAVLSGYRGSSGDVRVQFPLAFADMTQQVGAELSPGRGTTMVLVDLRSIDHRYSRTSNCG